jgi:hypothetical protein
MSAPGGNPRRLVRECTSERAADVPKTYSPHMTGETDLGRLLATMRPTLHPGEFVFTTAEEELAGVEPVVMVREAEGVTLVLDRAQAVAQ